MVDYREILRPNNHLCTKKGIPSSVHSSKNTIYKVLTLAPNLHICWLLDDDIIDASLEALLYPNRNKDNEKNLFLITLGFIIASNGSIILCTQYKNEEWDVQTMNMMKKVRWIGLS